MNDWNPLEHPFRSWTPRGPSSRVRARLFAGLDRTEAELTTPAEVRWAWLAPVMGCFLAMMVISSARGNHFSPVGPTDWLAAVASNQSYAAYVVAGFHSEQNSLQKDPIAWTNDARAPGEPITLRPSATNSLIR